MDVCGRGAGSRIVLVARLRSCIFSVRLGGPLARRPGGGCTRYQCYLLPPFCPLLLFTAPTQCPLTLPVEAQTLRAVRPVCGVRRRALCIREGVLSRLKSNCDMHVDAAWHAPYSIRLISILASTPGSWGSGLGRVRRAAVAQPAPVSQCKGSSLFHRLFLRTPPHAFDLLPRSPPAR